MKKLYDTLIKHTYLGHFLHKFFIKLYNLYLSFLTDEQHARTIFNARFSFKLNLKNPRSLNEKIQWLKLYERTDLNTICADKYLVRDYVANLIGEDYLIPLVMVTDDVTKFTKENMIKEPIILKTNHTSSHYHIVRNTNNYDWDLVRKDFSNWLNENIYYSRREWQYKNIKPLVVVEKLLLDENNNIPDDYKFHCFNGKVEFIQVDIGRGSSEHYRNYYYPDWSRAPFKWSSKFNSTYTDPAAYDVAKPKNLEELLFISSKLSSQFRYVRVDLYECRQKVYFGEITFHHDGGFRPIIPVEFDYKLGELLEL